MNRWLNVLKSEFVAGKEWYDFAFLAVGLILQIIATTIGYVTGNPESIGLTISGIAGVISVVLCSQGKLSFYFFGFIQLFTYVFCFTLPNNLHGETIENGMYFLTMLYGIYAWARRYCVRENHSMEIHSKLLTFRGNLIAHLIFIGGTMVYWAFLANVPMFGGIDSDPFWDSITSVPAYIAQILMILGYREQWTYWFILDVLSIVLAIRAGSIIMAAQFIFWSANCIYGFIKWTKMSTPYLHIEEND